jgi:S1-C subfamily serine protease
MRRPIPTAFRHCLAILALLCLLPALFSNRAGALPSETLDSVVSVLPVWPGQAQGSSGTPPGVAPEGSGVVLPSGLIATAWHVIEPAERIDVRLSDGRVLPARLIASDAASDIALLRVKAKLTGLAIAPEPVLAQPVCAIGNAWGLGLSVTCGVVSALNVTDAGFNTVEHFVQTDAAANPGMSGGALVDPEGRLVGMVSAIFASGGDTNIGVNFAVSTDLMLRVTDALAGPGSVTYPVPGWQLGHPDRGQLARRAAPVVLSVAAAGAAEAAGIKAGDLLVSVGEWRVLTPRDAIAALAVLPEGTPRVAVTLERGGDERSVVLGLNATAKPAETATSSPECPHPAPVCAIRQAVFPVSGFDPVGSATRIGPDLLVTSRHVVADRTDVQIYTPDGPKEGRVIASAYAGDLALIEVDGLPDPGLVLSLDAPDEALVTTYAVGADVARQEVRVFDPGTVIALPAPGAPLGRLHVTSYMQPGVSGGALVDEAGRLVGISAGGGEGRYEAIPAQDLRALLALREDAQAFEIAQRLGTALATCAGMMERFDAAETAAAEALAETCAGADNHGQLLEAGRLLALAGAFDAAITLHQQAVAQVPNSINARISLLVSLQLAARFDEMTLHARRVMELAPDDPRVLRFAIQSGIWGGAPELAEAAYSALLLADPVQAQAARRFIDAAPPAPVRR